MIADLHQDIMSDGEKRTEAFVADMRRKTPNALLQVGDFAYPNAKNRAVIDRFNNAHPTTLHVIGNHDTDSGHTKEQCIDIWGMPSRFYTKSIDGLHVVLDGNDTGSPDYQGEWVGKSPAELGATINQNLIHGEHVAPRIRDRRIRRAG